MRTLLALALFLTLAAPAFAEEKEGKDKAADNGRYVNISAVAAPIVLRGQLINYIFVTVRLELAPHVDANKLREREPYFRDALVRAAHRRPFVKPGDYVHVDEAALKAAMMVESARIAGPNVVTQVDILTAQPQRVTGLPKDGPSTVQRAPIP